MVTLVGELRLIAVDKGVLMRYLDIIRTNCQEDGKKLNRVELRGLYFPPNIIRVMK